jgi:hypothetical protein
MKKMKLIGLMTLLAVFSLNISKAQSNEYKLDMSSGKLIVKDINEVEFEGHTGNGVIIKRRGQDHETSERAKGLKLINGLGLTDNTGIGLNAEKKGDGTVLTQISSNGDGEYVVLVPKGVTIVYEHSSPHGDDVLLRNITGEIEVTTNHSGVKLDNVTGPMSISTVHGDIEGNFGGVNQSGPISIVSSHGDIDLALPTATKADFRISTGWGEIYSDLDIKVDANQGSMKQYGANKVVGKLNGGGVSFEVKSSHGSIYLRKK